MTERMLTVLSLKALSSPKSEDGDRRRRVGSNHQNYTGLHKLWLDFDERFMKLWFGGDPRSHLRDSSVLVNMAEMVESLPMLRDWRKNSSLQSNSINISVHNSDSDSEGPLGNHFMI